MKQFKWAIRMLILSWWRCDPSWRPTPSLSAYFWIWPYTSINT